MADALTVLQQRANEDWLIGCDNREFWVTVEQASRELQEWRSSYSNPNPPLILLAEPNPVHFLARLVAAHSNVCHLCLANPNWVTDEWQQVFDQIQPNLVWGWEVEAKGQDTERGRHGEKKTQREGERERGRIRSLTIHYSLSTQHSVLSPQSSVLLIPSPPRPLILIPTGGSSGKIRFATHTWETLLASVRGFQQYFGVSQINSLCVLPLYHVSGLMQFLRSFVSGGKLAIFPFKALEGGNYPDITPADFFLSLVPTQLQRLLSPLPTFEVGSVASKAGEDNFKTPRSPLPHFKTVLLGGAPAWDELLDDARQQGIRLAPTYGMTETAAQIATLKPDDFLNGQTGCSVLPHAQVEIWDSAGKSLPAGEVGSLAICTPSLAIGYYPDRFRSPWFQPGDLGYFDSHGSLHIVGRKDDKIITGGENVFPVEVEAAIRATGLVTDVCVVGVDDRHWGQVVVAVYIPTAAGSLERVKLALEPKLSKYKRPKHWIAVEQMPRNAQGKVNRPALLQLLTIRAGRTNREATLADAAANPDVGEFQDECKRDESALG